jgi:DNA-binding NtrC family response regulator
VSRTHTPPLWIVHRDERLRAALRRLAGAGDEAVLGAPDDTAFRDAPSPRVVLLGLAGDFEAELEFAHRLAERLPAARWLLLVEPGERVEAERLFDALAADWLAFPPTAAELRARLRAAAGRHSRDELSKRRLRDALAARFARYFADLELPEVLRAVDPRLASVPLLVLGEPGTGRSLLARYVHVFGGSAGSWYEVECRGIGGVGGLRDALAAAQQELDPGQVPGVTVCLRDVDALPAPVQFALRSWVELGPPGPLARARRLRWIATAGDAVGGLPAPGLAPELAEALSGLAQRLPPLRERSPEAIVRFAADTVLAWCRARGERPRSLAPDAEEVLAEYPWPGNHRELEAVLVRTLAAEAGDPIRAPQLRFELGVEPILGEADAGSGARAEGARPAARAVPRAERRGEPAGPAGVPGAAAAPARGAPASPGPAAAVQGPKPEEGPGPAEEGPAREGAGLGRLAESLAHELRNRLVAIRTFAALLPERAGDRAFREEFGPAVGADVRRIEETLERLARFAALPEAPRRERVDVAALLEERLEALRGEIEARRLLVLKELDRTQPHALGDPAAIAFAFEALLARALAWVPERGDLYLASKAVAAGPSGRPGLRVVLRFHRPGERRTPAGAVVPPERELALDVVLAEQALRRQGGTLRLDATDAEETVIVADLPSE